MCCYRNITRACYTVLIVSIADEWLTEMWARRWRRQRNHFPASSVGQEWMIEKLNDPCGTIQHGKWAVPADVELREFLSGQALPIGLGILVHQTIRCVLQLFAFAFAFFEKHSLDELLYLLLSLRDVFSRRVLAENKKLKHICRLEIPTGSGMNFQPAPV
jgi:hypothetical protein